MQKRKQFQLRTVLATGWIEPKVTVTLHAFFNAESKSNIRVRTQQSPRKKRIATQQKDTNLVVKSTLASRSQRKSTIVVSEPRSDLKQFPIRQSGLKNSNAFRYFLHSNRRLITQTTREEQIFFKKLDQIIKDGPHARTIHKFDTLITKDGKLNSKERKKSIQPKQAKRRHTIGDNHGIEPWRFKQEQDFNDLHIH